MSGSPLRVAVTGMGGFAAVHHRALLSLEEEGLCKVVATCDPAPEAFAESCREWRLHKRGVHIFDDYGKMLEAHGDHLDVMVIPAPVPLHAEMHALAVERGLSVFLEKPPTLDPLELERMIQVDGRAPRPACVGFNFIRQPNRRVLKQRLLDGEFGTPREVRVFGCWPRSQGYFQRNDWVAKLLAPDGRPMPDSCLGNAMSHYVHNALFWAGLDDVQAFAPVREVRAELYRARRIEGADTVFVEVLTATELLLRFALTHSCHRPHRQGEEVVCDRATVEWGPHPPARVLPLEGEEEALDWKDSLPLPDNLRAYFDFVRTGEGYAGTTLAECRPFVHVDALMYLSAKSIQTLSDDRVEVTGLKQDPLPVIRDFDALRERFLREGEWPGGERPDTATPEDLPEFKDILHAIRAESGNH